MASQPIKKDGENEQPMLLNKTLDLLLFLVTMAYNPIWEAEIENHRFKGNLNGRITSRESRQISETLSQSKT